MSMLKDFAKTKKYEFNTLKKQRQKIMLSYMEHIFYEICQVKFIFKFKDIVLKEINKIPGLNDITQIGEEKTQ